MDPSQIRSIEHAYQLARRVEAADVRGLARALGRERRPARRRWLSLPLTVALARRAEQQEPWEPDLDRSIDLPTLAGLGTREPWLIEQVTTVVRSLPPARGRRVLEPCFAPRVRFATGALAFRLSGLVPLVEPAYYWLARVASAGDLPADRACRWIRIGIAEQPDPTAPVLCLLHSLVQHGVDPRTGDHPDRPRRRLVAELRAGVARNRGLGSFDELTEATARIATKADAPAIGPSVTPEPCCVSRESTSTTRSGDVLSTSSSPSI